MADRVEAVRQALVSLVFEETQPDRGDIFGWFDDRAEQIARAIIRALERSLTPIPGDRLEAVARAIHEGMLASFGSAVIPFDELNDIERNELLEVARAAITAYEDTIEASDLEAVEPDPVTKFNDDNRFAREAIIAYGPPKATEDSCPTCGGPTPVAGTVCSFECEQESKAQCLASTHVRSVLQDGVGETISDLAAEMRAFAMSMRRDDSDARSDDLRFYYEAFEGFANQVAALSANTGERGRIVEWLRSQVGPVEPGLYEAGQRAAFSYAADSVEAGEHLGAFRGRMDLEVGADTRSRPTDHAACGSRFDRGEGSE